MSKILYEASYIGNSRSFFNFTIVFVGLIFLWIVLIYNITEAKRENCGSAGYTAAPFVGIVSFVLIVGGIGTYGRDILGYKWRREYREVKGIVEDYTKHSNRYTFTVNGVEFEISGCSLTWGYSYWQGENVITGDGQQLKIRYIPGLNSIVYIEEIGPPLTRLDDTEEAQQVDMAQEEEIEESDVSTDQVGIQERTEEETKLIQNILSQDIDRIEIQGRTEEETELIRKILSQDKEEFQSFLMADGVYPYKEAIWVSAYDLTGDGRDEILVSKYYVDMSAELTYNYVYDQMGGRVLEFVGGGDTRIIDGWDGDGTFLLYDKNYYFYAPRYNTNTYTEIRCEDDVLSEKVILVALDRRPPRDYGKEEYYIFTDFTKEEEEKLWEGGLGVNELTETKEYVREDKRADEYRELFQEGETTGFMKIAVIRYSESDESMEYIEEDCTIVK